MPIGGAAGNPVAVSYFRPFAEPNFGATVIGIGTIPLTPILVPFPAQFSAVDLFVSNSYSATNAGSSMAHTISAFVALYTKNGLSLSRASSGSITYAFTVTGSSSSVSFQGLKNLTIPMVVNMTPGNYWYAISSSTSGDAGNNAIAGVFSNLVNSLVGAESGYAGVFGASTFVSESPVLGYGSYSVTSAAFPAAIGFSELVGSALGNTASPIVNFKNYTV